MFKYLNRNDDTVIYVFTISAANKVLKMGPKEIAKNSLPLKSLDFLFIVPEIRPYAIPMIVSGMMKLNSKDTIVYTRLLQATS